MVSSIKRNSNIQICELCGSVFKCYSKKIQDCWCYNEPHIVVDYSVKNCLCKNCLEKKKILESH